MKKEKIIPAVKAWLDRVEAAFGKKPIIYSGFYFLKDYLSEAGGGPPAWAKDYPLWLAQYPDQYVDGMQPSLPKGWFSWTIWQYSEKGRLNGINAYVDLDLFNGTLEDLYKFAGAKMITETPKVPQKHTVVAGDSFESVANKYGVTVRELVTANPQLLKSGEALTIPVAVAIPAESGGSSGGGTLSGTKTYTVKSGDSLYNMFPTDCIPNPQELSPSPVAQVILATQSGDTLTLAMGSQSGSRGPLSAATRESFTVRRFFYARPDGLPGIRVSVSAFGITQEFSGFSIHRILADAGTDDDEIHVYGNFDEVRLNGGPGNDVLEYRGNGNVVLNGDDGADTLRAENGIQNLMSMNGGAGYDKIYIGAGRLDSIQTSLITGVINAGPDAGGLYFDNSEETEDTTYEFGDMLRNTASDISKP